MVTIMAKNIDKLKGHTCSYNVNDMITEYMDVSENRGFPPNHPLKNRVFHYKPSILGYPYFRKHPYNIIYI